MNYQLTKEPPLDPPEPEIAYICDVCGETIYEGEEYYEIHGDTICSECIRDYIDMEFKKVAEMEEPDYEDD